MTGLVEQLQADALDHTTPVSTLLRKVKVCAAKLGLDDALLWVDQELSGYTCAGNELPPYRVGYALTVCQDAFGRWSPFAIDNSEWAEKISMVHLREQVSSYEDLLHSDGTTFELPVDHELVCILNDAFGQSIIAMRNKISRGHILGIVEKVRNLVLDWSLDLARSGITGEGLLFSDNEKARAVASHISIGTFSGSLNTGNAAGAGARIDQKTHIHNDFTPIKELVAAVQAQVVDTAKRKAIVEAAEEIARAQNKPSMLAAYERLLAAAADHMTVIAPFLPAIGAMLAG